MFMLDLPVERLKTNRKAGPTGIGDTKLATSFTFNIVSYDSAIKQEQY